MAGCDVLPFPATAKGPSARSRRRRTSGLPAGCSTAAPTKAGALVADVPNVGRRRCECFDLHQQMIPFAESWAWQQSIVTRRKGLVCRDEDHSDTLVALQHPPVYTLGTDSTEDYLHFSVENAPFEVHRIDRGGEVTYHGPGQHPSTAQALAALVESAAPPPPCSPPVSLVPPRPSRASPSSPPVPPRLPRASSMYFPFDTEADTALSVATEMVAELDITDHEVTRIAEMIDGEVDALVLDWRPGPGMDVDDDAPDASSTACCQNCRSSSASSSGSLLDFMSSAARRGCRCAELHGRFEEITFQADKEQVHFQDSRCSSDDGGSQVEQCVKDKELMDISGFAPNDTGKGSDQP